jgi:EAL domain-containing protein (putative c-di-GMP-specific phosphodiesterase class I)
MLGMSKALGLKVVAEGVETRAQAERLVAHGCNVMQGFWFARPMPAADLQALLERPRPPDWKMNRARERDEGVPAGESVHAA